jgi:hypothetical protein
LRRREERIVSGLTRHSGETEEEDLKKKRISEHPLLRHIGSKVLKFAACNSACPAGFF